MKTQVLRIVAAVAINLGALTGALSGTVVTGQAVSLPQTLKFDKAPGVGTCTTTSFVSESQWASGCQPEVEIDNTLTSTQANVQDTISLALTAANGASLNCTSGTTRTAVSGLVDFAGCSVDKAGTYTLTASDTTNPQTTQSATSPTFTITAGPTTQLGVSGLANPSTAGTAESFTVTPEDSAGNPSSDYTGTVHFSSSDASATLPNNTTFNKAAAPFQVTFGTAGNQSVIATDIATSSITGSETVPVNAGPATNFAVSAPSNATAGAPFNFTVTAQDHYGNTATAYGGTVHFTSSDTHATLPADSTLSGGTGTFQATLNTAGSQTITATDSTTSSITGPSGSITVATGSGIISFTQQPATNEPVLNGGFESGDLSNWTASTVPSPQASQTHVYSGAWSAQLGSPSAPAVQGTTTLAQTFTVPSGTPTLSFLYYPQTSATDSTANYQQVQVICGACTGPTQNTVTVFHNLSNAQSWLPVQFDLTYAAGKSVNVLFSVADASTTAPTAMWIDDVSVDGQGAGSAFANQPQVHVEDNSHNAISGAQVTLGLVPGTGTAGAALACTNVTVTTDSSGNASFAGCKIDTTGYYYEVQATGSGMQGATSAPFSVPGAILAFGQSPSNSTGGVAFATQPTVLSKNGDSISTNMSDSSTHVTLGITTGTGAPGAALTCTGGQTAVMSSGTASYSGCGIDKATATAYSLTATGVAADGTHAFPAMSGTFTISAGPTARFELAGLGNTTAGQTQTLTVTPTDAGGNAPNPAYAGPVYITFSPANSGSSAPASTSSCSPSCDFNVQLTQAGTDTVTAKNAASSPSISTGQAVSVAPASATTLQVAAPSSAPSGTPFNFSVTALDQYGNTATGYAGTVDFTTSDGAGTVPASSTLTNGTGTFQATLNTAGPQTITATDHATSSITGTSGPIQVLPGAPDHLTISPQNVSTTTGTRVVYTVNAYDATNNPIGDVTSQATFSITAPGDCTGGTGTNGAAPGNNQCTSTTSRSNTVTATYGGKSISTSLFTCCGTTWTASSGGARDVAAWSGTTFWAIGTDSQPGGYGIWKNTSGSWAREPGGAVRVAVGPSGNAVVANSGGSLYQWNGTSGWNALTGGARDVAVGDDGAGHDSIWVIGTDSQPGGYGIWHLSAGTWSRISPGGGVRIAVGPDGTVYVLNTSGQVWHWTGTTPAAGSWTLMTGASGSDIGTGPTGTVWITGTNSVPGGGSISEWNPTSSTWNTVPGGATQITVAGNGLPIVANSVFSIYKRS